ncbi:MAG: DMP19 family protein [Alistipes sp.]|nr:DMP19 family protein [Alistipes sp.]
MAVFGFLKKLFGGGSSALTREEIAALPAGKLVHRVLYSLPDAESANEAQRDFVSMVMLDGEVRNGGFNQYYYNTGEERQRAAEAFARAGAADAAELVRQADGCYDANRERLAGFWDGTMKGFSASYKERFFDRFDTEYYALMDKKRFQELLAGFVRSHAGDFIPRK